MEYSITVSNRDKTSLKTSILLLSSWAFFTVNDINYLCFKLI